MQYCFDSITDKKLDSFFIKEFNRDFKKALALLQKANAQLKKKEKNYLTEDLASLILLHFYSITTFSHKYKGMSCYYTWWRKQFMEFSLLILDNSFDHLNSFVQFISYPSLILIGFTMLWCVLKAQSLPIVFFNCRQHWQTQKIISNIEIKLKPRQSPNKPPEIFLKVLVLLPLLFWNISTKSFYRNYSF